MEQMPANLDVLQIVSASKSYDRQNVKGESSKKGDFDQMMNQVKEQTGMQKSERVEDVTETDDRKQTVDIAALQELTALQMLSVDTRQIVVVQETSPEQQMVCPVVEASDATVMTAAEEVPQVKQAADQKIPVMQQMETGEQKVMETVPETPATLTENRSPDMGMQQDSKETVVQSVAREDVTEEKPKMSEVDSFEISGEDQRVFKQVETAPIKVGETTVESTVPKGVENQVGEALTKALATGETKVELQLTPEHLGKITIELTQKHDGVLEITLHAENSQTRVLLERDLPNMQNLFSRSTQQEVLVEVPRHQETQQNESYDGHQQRQQQEQQEQRHQQERNEDFLNQMRLGFVPVDEVTA